MLQYITIWASENWIALASLMIACIALFYAVRGSNTSKNAADAARASDLTDLMIRAKDSLIEVDRSFHVLQRSCNQTRADWNRYTRKHVPPLSAPSATIDRTRKVERDGEVLLRNAKQRLAGIEELNTTQLARGLVEIKTAAIQIEGLVAQLEGPPNYFD